MGYFVNGCHRLSVRTSITLPNSPTAPPTSEISNGFGKELPQNAQPARSQRQPQSNFPGTVRGACGKQAAQVGARGQQNQPCQQHQSGHECAYRLGKIVAIKTGARQGKVHVAVFFGIGLFQVCADGVQVGNRLFRSDSRLQMPHHRKNPTLAALVQVILSRPAAPD